MHGNRVFPVVATAVAAIILVISAVAYSPKPTSTGSPPPLRISDARNVLLSADGSAATALREALGAADVPARTLDLVNVTATVSSATLRPDGEGLILSVVVSSITNQTDASLSFAGATQCGASSANSSLHQEPAVPYVYVTMFNTVLGYRWHDGDSWENFDWARPTDQPSGYIDAGGDAANQSGHHLFLDAYPHILKTIDCEAGLSSTSKHSLRTNFDVPHVEAGQTKQLRTNNIIEFDIPPAPQYVSDETPLDQSAYPYLIGGVFLVSTDYSAAAWIDLG